MYDEVIDVAIDALKNGWTKGISRDDEGNVCAVGALEVGFLHVFQENYVNFGTLDYRWIPMVRTLDDVTHELHGFDSIVNFNDANSTTVDDVIQIFEKVRAKEQI